MLDSALSVGKVSDEDVKIVRWPGRRMLAVPVAAAGFAGRVVDRGGAPVRLVPLSHAAAARVREVVPWARPQGFGPSGSSFGFGDRLGLATPGHVRALQSSRGSLRPLLAQQSARELERTGRSFADVLDAATWGVLDAGWRQGYGADADHLKTSAEVATAIEAGFTMLTLDPGDRVDTAAAQSTGVELERRIGSLPWSTLEDDWAAMRRRHAAFVTESGELALARAAATYGSALAHVAVLVRGIPGDALAELDVEISLDETGVPTSALDHAFVVTELRRLGVFFTAVAPRFEGRWEKAVDVGGDLDRLRRSIHAHAAVAARLGPYRLSVHSGSDKPTLYPMLGAAGGTWHLKTSGTSYLEALRVVARHDPDLMRAVVTVAAANLQGERASYAISSGAALPDSRDVQDAELGGLLDGADSRQCLHVTYGSVLGDPQLGRRLRTTLEGLADEYGEALETHFAWHLGPLAALA